MEMPLVFSQILCKYKNVLKSLRVLRIIYYHHGQEPVARQIIGPKRQPTTIVLLNGHIKLTSHELSLSSYINASLNPYKRSFDLQ